MSLTQDLKWSLEQRSALQVRQTCSGPSLVSRLILTVFVNIMRDCTKMLLVVYVWSKPYNKIIY